MPHDGEIGSRSKVLCDSNGRVQVEDDVPPASGYKHGLAWILDGLDRFILLRPVQALGLGIDDVKPRDGLVTLLPALAGLDRDQLLGRVRGEETPSLVTRYQGVPGRGPQWVNVDPCP